MQLRDTMPGESLGSRPTTPAPRDSQDSRHVDIWQRQLLRRATSQAGGRCESLGSESAKSTGSRRPRAEPLSALSKAALFCKEVSDGYIYVVNVSLDPLLSGCLTWTMAPGDRGSAPKRQVQNRSKQSSAARQGATAHWQRPGLRNLRGRSRSSVRGLLPAMSGPQFKSRACEASFQCSPSNWDSYYHTAVDARRN